MTSSASHFAFMLTPFHVLLSISEVFENIRRPLPFPMAAWTYNRFLIKGTKKSSSNTATALLTPNYDLYSRKISMATYSSPSQSCHITEIKIRISHNGYMTYLTPHLTILLCARSEIGQHPRAYPINRMMWTHLLNCHMDISVKLIPFAEKMH